MKRCDFITSHHDAQGGSEVKVASNVATVDECIKLVNDKRIGEPSIEEVNGKKVDWSMINGMTYMSTGSKDCYAEINDKRIGDYGCTNNCQTCIFIGRFRKFMFRNYFVNS